VKDDMPAPTNSGLNDQLDEVDRRVNALNRQAEALLDAENIC
jgi:hypothetical protein